MVAEIDRVAQNTKFNGVALLDGTFTSKAFQIGADTTDTVSISIDRERADHRHGVARPQRQLLVL